MSSVKDNVQESVAVCFLCQNASAASNYSGNNLENNLKVIFLLRELLGISVDLCANYLQKYGDPSSWFHICPPCEEVISEGRNLFKKMKQLEEQLQEVKTKVMCQTRVKIELNVMVPEAEQEIRQDLFENYGDYDEGQEDEESSSLMDFEINPNQFNVKIEAEDSDNLSDLNEEELTVKNNTNTSKTKKEPKNVVRKSLRKEMYERLKKLPKKKKVVPFEVESDEEYVPNCDEEYDDESFSEEEKDPTFIPEEKERKKNKSASSNRKLNVKTVVNENEKADTDPMELKELLEEDLEDLLEDFPHNFHPAKTKAKSQQHMKKIDVELLKKCGPSSPRKIHEEAKPIFEEEDDNFLEEIDNSPLKVDSDHSQKEEDPDSSFNVQDYSDKSDDKPIYSKPKRHRQQVVKAEIKETKRVNEFPFPCPFESCRIYLTKREHFEDHYRNFHLPESAITCSGCKNIFTLLPRYKFHLDNAKNDICLQASLKCSLCDARASSQEALDIHFQFNHVTLPPPPPSEEILPQNELKSEEPTGSLPYKETNPSEVKYSQGKFCCPEESCGQFLSLHNLEFHVQSRHLPPSALICSGCNKISPSKKKFKKHLQTSENCVKSAVKCPQCKVLTQTQETLQVHLTISHGLYPYSPLKCKVCGKECNSRSVLSSHSRLHDLKDKNAFVCEKCGAGFALENGLKKHIANVHATQKFPCSICHREFKGSSNKAKHELLHYKGKSYLCSQCGKCFKTEEYLKFHMQTHDPDKHLKYLKCKPNRPRYKYKKGNGINRRVQELISSNNQDNSNN